MKTQIQDRLTRPPCPKCGTVMTLNYVQTWREDNHRHQIKYVWKCRKCEAMKYEYAA